MLRYVAAVTPWVLKVHLALFYLSGTYYEIPKRLTGASCSSLAAAPYCILSSGSQDGRFAGTRFIFLGKLFEQRPSYRILGVLMLVQLATSAVMWGLAHPKSPVLVSGREKASASTEPSGPAVVVEASFSTTLTASLEGSGCETHYFWNAGGRHSCSSTHQKRVAAQVSTVPLATRPPHVDGLWTRILLGVHLGLGEPEAGVPALSVARALL